MASFLQLRTQSLDNEALRTRLRKLSYDLEENEQTEVLGFLLEPPAGFIVTPGLGLVMWDRNLLGRSDIDLLIPLDRSQLSGLLIGTVKLKDLKFPKPAQPQQL